MKKDNTVLRGILGGLGVGLCLFLLNRAGVNTSFVMPVCLGILVLILDYICFRPVFTTLRNRKLMEKGIGTVAIISEIMNMAVHPKNLVRDAMGNFVLPPDTDKVPTMYQIKLSYIANDTEYQTEVIVSEVTANELLPYRMREGEDIPIKYLQSDPEKVIIDIPSVAGRYEESNSDFRSKGPFTAFVMTTIYIFYLIKRIF